MDESKKLFVELIKSYANYAKDQSQGMHTFMEFVLAIERWSQQLNYNQIETLNELRKIFPLYFVAHKRCEFKNAKFTWRGKQCKYNLVFIVAKTSNKIRNQLFIENECNKYGLNYNDKNALDQNMKDLLDSGYIMINSDIDSFSKENPNETFCKY